ncbi:coagulation factor III, tissue factor a [Xiphophorus hellerii]|uniref:coagulation factor III, tissue factor a n=1 Tax=Xiphophorus hellerii TaxID=8084 RepID=UPI0013B35EA5|nr:tissue factor [Xiphophorus hellerii]
MKLQTSLVMVLLSTHCTSGAAYSYPRAQNVTWSSTNFKTILSWEPKPSADYSYTVEFSVAGGDRQRNHHCIRSNTTMCDLSVSLTELKSCYSADILSEPPLGTTSDDTEFPHTTSPRFCPYQDTEIGKPTFNLTVHEDKKTITLHVTDPLTAVFKDDHQLSIRDIFSDELQYKVLYRKQKSTGTKMQMFSSSVIEMTNLDKGESYCFSVQAHIPSRRSEKQFGQLSATKCSHNDEEPILKVYSPAVIAGGILFILLVIGLIITITVIYCSQKRKALKSGAEGCPLRDV